MPNFSPLTLSYRKAKGMVNEETIRFTRSYFVYLQESTWVSMAPMLIIDYGTKVVDLIPEDVPSHVCIIPNLLGHTLKAK